MIKAKFLERKDISYNQEHNEYQYVTTNLKESYWLRKYRSASEQEILWEVVDVLGSIHKYDVCYLKWREFKCLVKQEMSLLD